MRAVSQIQTPRVTFSVSGGNVMLRQKAYTQGRGLRDLVHSSKKKTEMLTNNNLTAFSFGNIFYVSYYIFQVGTVNQKQQEKLLSFVK